MAKRFATPEPEPRFKRFRQESPCRSCAKQGLSCWCAELGAWQRAEFGVKEAAISRKKLKSEAALKAWETRREDKESHDGRDLCPTR